MKAIYLMFDSLRRDFLPCYGGTEAQLPNFRRLAERTVVFDGSYAGSLPCMPARRELHTGRYNFLHCSWGPMEPFDVSMPELLKQNGVHSALITDHYHYLQDGGATYQGRYSSWQCFRGQESDAWIGDASPREDLSHAMSLQNLPQPLRAMRTRGVRQNAVNRAWRGGAEERYSQTLTFNSGMEFMRRNAGEDNWFLQLEVFDPHEPFDAPAAYQRPGAAGGADWPPYAPVSETPGQVEAMRRKYIALLEYCDANLGRLLDEMDRLDLWKDTLLIVGTDHGFLLGEHGWWGKNLMPDYEEIVHTPLFIWDPRSGRRGERRGALVQTVDLCPTILEYFGLPIPAEVQGHSLRQTLEDDTPVRQYALFGYFGAAIGVTDGRWAYLRAPQDDTVPVMEYTLMPTRIMGFTPPQVLQQAALHPPLPFTRGCPVLCYPGAVSKKMQTGTHLLFDLQTDPKQQQPLTDAAAEQELCRAMARAMRENDAPPELYQRFRLPCAAD